MAAVEKNVVFIGEDKSGDTVIYMPVTNLASVEDTADEKPVPSNGDYVPVMDSADGGQMKKTKVSGLKEAMELQHLDNTPDAEKPVSAPQQAALDRKADNTLFQAHTGNKTMHITNAERDRWNDKAESSTFNTHVENKTAHVTVEERGFWNSKSAPGHTHDPSDAQAVPLTRKINGKTLNSDISLSASDVGARPMNWMPSASDVGAPSNTEFNRHSTDSVKHITALERNEWNSKADNSSFSAHASNTTLHITASERQTWNNKQNALTFDSSPKSGSGNPVTSGGVYSALSGKANSSHGTHVSYSSAAPLMAGTASVGSASTVARSDHRHPTDTSRAAASELTAHAGDTTKHITAAEREAWNRKQDALTFDTMPKSGSSNPVTSGGLYSKFEEKVPWTEVSNTNLLDNCYFADPINQKGKTTYTGAGYTIDRWHSSGDITVSLTDDGIILHNNSGVNEFCQKLDTDIINFIRGKTVTYSILTTSGELYWLPMIIPNKGGFDSGNINLVSWVGDIITDESGSNISVRLYTKTSGSEIRVKAVKLELGDHQTLACQDASGKWILNDPPPDRALELLNCQRYQIFGKLLGTKCWTKSTGSIGVFFPTPSTMRANPGLVGQLTYMANNSTDVNVYPVNFSMESDPNGVYMYLQGSGIDFSSVTYFEIPAGSGFDANL